MAEFSALLPLHECIANYPSDAPQWGDELLDTTKVSGLASELRKHLVDALLASRQPPLDGPEAVRSYILDGKIMPLKRKWRAYVLDNRRRLMVRHHHGGVRVRSWVSRRVFDATELATKLPLDGGWAYLIVYGGADTILPVTDGKSGSVADDLYRLRNDLPICDVVGWHMLKDGKGVRWWSLAGAGGMDGLDSFDLDPAVLAKSGGNGWGSRQAPQAVERSDKARPLHELIPNWDATDPQWGDELLEADSSNLSGAAQQLRRHMLLATRTGAELTVSNPEEARLRLTERIFRPKVGKWSAYVLDENRRRDMIPSEWGQSARQATSETTPTIEWLQHKLPLPNKGRWLILWWGGGEKVCDGSSELDLLLANDSVADVCAWSLSTFASARAKALVDQNNQQQILTVEACLKLRNNT